MSETPLKSNKIQFNSTTVSLQNGGNKVESTPHKIVKT